MTRQDLKHLAALQRQQLEEAKARNVSEADALADLVKSTGWAFVKNWIATRRATLTQGIEAGADANQIIRYAGALGELRLLDMYFEERLAQTHARIERLDAEIKKEL